MPAIQPDGHRQEAAKGDFNAVLAAGVLAFFAVVPSFFVPFLWWPFAGVILFAAFVLCVVGLVQGRVFAGVVAMIFVCIVAPAIVIISPLVTAGIIFGARQSYQAANPSPSPASTPPLAEPIQMIAAAPREAVPTPPLRTVPDSTEAPAQPLPTPSFDAQVSASKKRALERHPDLGILNSSLNRRFIFRHQALVSTGDPLLKQADWPEKLADICDGTTPAPIEETTSVWKTSRPPYPYQARASRVQGSGAIRITTDSSGRVISAVISQSVGNGVLDSNTVQWAKFNWRGPANSSTTVPVIYRLQ